MGRKLTSLLKNSLDDLEEDNPMNDEEIDTAIDRRDSYF